MEWVRPVVDEGRESHRPPRRRRSHERNAHHAGVGGRAIRQRQRQHALPAQRPASPRVDAHARRLYLQSHLLQPFPPQSVALVLAFLRGDGEIVQLLLLLGPLVLRHRHDPLELQFLLQRPLLRPVVLASATLLDGLAQPRLLLLQFLLGLRLDVLDLIAQARGAVSGLGVLSQLAVYHVLYGLDASATALAGGACRGEDQVLDYGGGLNIARGNGMEEGDLLDRRHSSPQGALLTAGYLPRWHLVRQYSTEARAASYGPAVEDNTPAEAAGSIRGGEAPAGRGNDADADAGGGNRDNSPGAEAGTCQSPAVPAGTAEDARRRRDHRLRRRRRRCH